VRVVREEPARLVPRYPLPHPLAALRELAVDLGLDRLQILLPDRLREVEVVVEAVLDRGPDSELHPGIEPGDRLGEQVRRRVAQHRQRVRIVLVAGGEDLDRLTLRQRHAQVLHTSVDAPEHRLLGELRTDRPRRVEPGPAVRKFKFGIVGEEHLQAGQGYARGLPGRSEMPGKRPSVKNEKQYEKLKEKGMSKERAARIANSPGSSSRGGKSSGSGTRRSNSSQGGTTAQKKAAGRKGGRAAARKS